MNRRELLELLTAVGLAPACAMPGADTHAPLPTALAHLIREHGDHYAPRYPPDDNSDHGPMACLAMHGLGINFSHIEIFARRYRRKLVAQLPSAEAVTASNWTQHLGRPDSYAALRAFYAADIAARGWQASLRQYLPVLISGWVKDAFHPLIRLGYGVEFNLPAEIASGLAYLTVVGPDTQLAALASGKAIELPARAYLTALQAWRDPAFSTGRFNSRYQHASQVVALQPVIGSNSNILKDFSRAALEVFDTTHDFFALHLVTSSHAFHVCSPWAGSEWQAVYSVGLATAYLAIGAPDFVALPPPAGVVVATSLPTEVLATSTDEHDIKIAYTAMRQARAFGDPAYVQVAARYLAGG